MILPGKECSRRKDLIGADWESKRVFFSLFSILPLTSKTSWRQGNWNSLCWVADATNNQFSVFVNNKPVLESKTLKYEVKNTTELVFMNVEGQYLFHGAMTDVQLWSRRLNLKELGRWFSCEDLVKGDLINWDTAELEVEGLEMTNVDEEEICRPKIKMKAFNKKLNFKQSLMFCKKYGDLGRLQLKDLSIPQLRDRRTVKIRSFSEPSYSFCKWRGQSGRDDSSVQWFGVSSL